MPRARNRPFGLRSSPWHCRPCRCDSARLVP